MQYKTDLADVKDGTATFGRAFVQYTDGTWQLLGQTNNYREYPRMVRARAAAESLCRAHQRKHFPLHTFTAIKA